jgi:hypothetical protein
MGLPDPISNYFWDINTDTASPRKHPRYYMTRILEIGNKRAIRWLLRVFGRKKIREVLPTLRLSSRSANYWHYYFKL